jgi:hypothetical protein
MWRRWWMGRCTRMGGNEGLPDTHWNCYSI